jgi:hypothetical protein
MAGHIECIRLNDESRSLVLARFLSVGLRLEIHRPNLPANDGGHGRHRHHTALGGPSAAYIHKYGPVQTSARSPPCKAKTRSRRNVSSLNVLSEPVVPHPLAERRFAAFAYGDHRAMLNQETAPGGSGMGRNFIVLRASPDWQSFDVESSRAFCLRVGVPETTIIDFLAIWDATLKVGYRVFRHRLKEIALSVFSAATDATIISYRELREMKLEADDRLAFTDDDDWYSPDVFTVPINEHGAYWGSIRLGRPFGPTFEYDRSGLLGFRPIVPIIYTSNYIVSGSAPSELGLNALLDHGAAQQTLEKGDFRPLPCDRYVYCANKTPAFTVSARYLLPLAEFRNNPQSEFVSFAEKLNSISIPACLPWLQEPFKQYRSLINEAVP